MTEHLEVEEAARRLGWPVYSARELAALLVEMLLAREGLELTPEVARERANNIAAALARTVIT
jgi:hypothetical protein